MATWHWWLPLKPFLKFWWTVDESGPEASLRFSLLFKDLKFRYCSSFFGLILLLLSSTWQVSSNLRTHCTPCRDMQHVWQMAQFPVRLAGWGLELTSATIGRQAGDTINRSPVNNNIILLLLLYKDQAENEWKSNQCSQKNFQTTASPENIDN